MPDGPAGPRPRRVPGDAFRLQHAASRGELKATVFYGSFLALALVGAWSIDRRKASAAADNKAEARARVSELRDAKN
ncbi:MAG: hypothetical protein FJY47_05780, partial [Betaproteobacteria bacterium]|nr:hypothetical protein [Betaproteobacteria bacterium]